MFNAVALLSSPDSNPADISYVTAGVAAPETPQTAVSVPLTGLGSSQKLTEDFKRFFAEIIDSVDSSGQFEEESLPEYHPPKFPDIYQEGRKGKMTLRPEYSPADVLMTGTGVPARNKSITVPTGKNVDIFEENIPIQDLKSKDQRSLILTYIDMVTQNGDAASTEHFDLVKLQRITKIDKPLQFFEDFCLALYKKCLTVKKGFKVGQTFLTQVQVNLILKHGVNATRNLILKHGVSAERKNNVNCKSQKYSDSRSLGSKSHTLCSGM